MSRKLGPSFPFLEDDIGKVSLAFDQVKVEKKDSLVTFYYIKDSVPMYSYTFKMQSHDNFTFSMTGISGKINVKVD